MSVLHNRLDLDFNNPFRPDETRHDNRSCHGPGLSEPFPVNAGHIHEIGSFSQVDAGANAVVDMTAKVADRLVGNGAASLHLRRGTARSATAIRFDCGSPRHQYPVSGAQGAAKADDRLQRRTAADALFHGPLNPWLE